MTRQNLQEPPGEIVDKATVRIERVLPGPIERLWAWLVESDKRAKWLAAGELDQRPGTGLDLLFRHGQLSHEETPQRWRGVDGHVNHCRITRCEPPHLLSFTWPEERGEDSEVTFELIPQKDDVLLIVTHERLYDRDTMVNVAGGWHAHLGLLVDHLNGRPPRGFWSAFEAVEKLYAERFPSTQSGA